MFPILTKAKLVKDFIIHFEFNDGVKSDVDFSGIIAKKSGVFEPLKDKEFFSNFEIYDEGDTIFWPNGADFAPEFLRELCEKGGVSNA